MAFQELNLAYQTLVKSLVGRNLIEWLEQERDSSLRKAEKSTDPHVAYGLIKNAHAYTVVLTHLELMSTKSAGDTDT